MLGKKNIGLPIYTDKINNQVNFDKEIGFNWKELNKQGFVKETVQEDGDFATITKEFVSTDGSLKKKEVMTIPMEEWEKLKIGMMSKEEAAKEIVILRKMLSELSEQTRYEECAEVRDKIQVIEKIIAV